MWRRILASSGRAGAAAAPPSAASAIELDATHAHTVARNIHDLSKRRSAHLPWSSPASTAPDRTSWYVTGDDAACRMHHDALGPHVRIATCVAWGACACRMNSGRHPQEDARATRRGVSRAAFLACSSTLSMFVAYLLRLDLKSKACHALAVFPDELLALACRFAVLLDAVTKFEEAVVTRALGFGACTASSVSPGR